MIEFGNGVRLVQDLSELPNLMNADEIFLDFETGSGDPKEDSLHPWHHCFIAGIGITVDKHEGSWYVPVGHEDQNLDKQAVFAWLNDIITTCKRWVNHNVKYDAQVWINDSGYTIPYSVDLVDTITQAKLLDSDRFNYGLDFLSKAWLNDDISKYEARLKPYLHRNKDYSRIPADILGEYGGQDVITNRRLHKFIRDRMPEQCETVSRTEIDLTRCLLDMERVGLRVNNQQLKIKQMEILATLLHISEKLHQLTGQVIRPHVNEDCYDVLCIQYGLPVLAYNESGNPSFDKNALAAYAAHPYAPKDIVKLMLAYRKLHTLNNFFVEPYLKLNIDELLYPQINQTVRTGRMSVKKPNAQQLSKDAKELILPYDKDHEIISIDYSQVEFRLICHYIQDEKAIAAYARDPFTDFHNWVAEMCGIPRSPAKNVNFAIGYGSGKKKVLHMLASNMDLVASLSKQVEHLPEEQQQAAFSQLAVKRALNVFNTYHATLPSLRHTSKRAERAARSRGYVFNLYGRRRHLPSKRAHIAFNTLNQSTAADLIKERVVAISTMLRGGPIKLAMVVHDELVFYAPSEILRDSNHVRQIVRALESPSVALRVPLRTSVGRSNVNWREAGENSTNFETS